MKRKYLTGIAATLTLSLGLTLGAADASAQTPTSPPSSPPPNAPPPGDPSTVVPGPPAPGGAVTRVHLVTEKNKGTARLYIHRSDGYTLVCASPCTADIPVNSELRITLNNNDDDPHTFTLSGEGGPEIDLVAKPASIGPFIGGIVTMGVGGVLALTGLLYLALADATNSTYDGSSYTSDIKKSEADTEKTIGWVCIGLGAAAAVVGLVVLVARSHEPRHDEKTHRPTEIYGRTDTLLGDIASLKPRQATTLKPAFNPLSYGFTF